MNKKGKESFFVKISHPKCFKTINFNRFHCCKVIAICRSLLISYDGIPNDNTHIRGCYCMSKRDSECTVFFYIFLKHRVVPVFV